MRFITAVLLLLAALAIFSAQQSPSSTGFDCTGNVDSTATLQAAVNAMPDTATIHFPLGCNVRLGTGLTSGQCGITITSRVGVQFKSDVLIGNFGGGLTPTFYWYGNGGTPFCVNSTDHPRFIGLSFQVAGGGNMDSCITFDGNPTTHIGTNGMVDYVACNNGSNNNPNFVGISISPTAGSNHENYEISHLYLGCSNSEASVRSRDGVTVAGSPNVSSIGAAFVAGDVGQPINISYPGENLQTTVVNVMDAQHVVLAANVPVAVSQATIITGQSYGIGLQNGANQNAIQQTFRRITYNRCHIGVRLAGGNAELDHINGGQSDTGIQIGGFVAEQVSINWYESEGDLRGIDSMGPLVSVNNSRASNGSQYADGFFRFGGIVNIQNTFVEFASPSGAVLVGKSPTSNPTITGINNIWRQTYAALGYPLIQMPPPTSINDNINGGAPAQFVFGCWNQVWSCIQINDIVPHVGNVALQVATSAQYSDVTTPVVAIQTLDTSWIIGSYVGLQVTPMTARPSAGAVPILLSPTPFALIAPCGAAWAGGIAAVSNGAAASWGSTISSGAAGPPSFLEYCDGVNWTLTGQ